MGSRSSPSSPRAPATGAWVALGTTVALVFAELPVGGALLGEEAWARREVLRVPLLLVSAQAGAAIVATGLALRARRFGVAGVAGVAAAWGVLAALVLAFCLWMAGLPMPFSI